jgi:hypothetical protein
MAQNNRNEMRERKGGEPRRYEAEDEKRYSSNRHEERARGMAKVNADRNDRMSSDRENDLYERQSI